MKSKMPPYTVYILITAQKIIPGQGVWHINVHKILYVLIWPEGASGA
jgi:hypothetical protein